MRPENI